ncbi:ABC transporter, transmembrane domain, type 1 [Akanthomyces lecanii RCEF 1005]|uniref:ABC transporter, transmembrane domain, type 1 n=1 Tax=Akanthomyces lecanii RCEF 1005 TaxID=1081108 RepID=A0A168DPI6_CORDF|nr:ABC transporter, transmembrane domain, type 1 [Akanthomyces lecanii RCEF 1005]
MALPPPPPAWSGDDTFGPRLPGHRDLTLLFENVVFAIVPAAVVLLFTPLYLRRALRERGPARIAWTLYLEIALAGGVFLTDLIGANLWSKSPYAPPYAMAAATIMFLAAIAMGFVLFIGRVRGRWPVLPTVYAATTALFDVVRMRSYVLRDMRDMAAVCIMTALIKILFLISGQISLRLRDRRALLRGQSIVDWAISTLSLGFRNNIHLEHLPELDPASKSVALFHRFQPHWANVNKKSRWPLLKACVKTLQWELTSALPPRLAFFAFIFSQPFLIQHVTLLVKHGRPPPDVIARVTAFTAFVFLGIGICKGYYRQVCHRVSTCLRGMLVSAIFEKTMHLECEVLQKKEAFELMETDLAIVEEMPTRFCDLVVSFPEVGFGTYLLHNYVGLWCCLVFIPCSLVAFMTAGMKYYKTAAKDAWNDKMKHREAATTNAMAQLQSIKAIGLAPIVSTNIQELYAAELQSSSYDRKLRLATHIMDIFAESITPMLVLIGSVSWIAFPNSHSACEVFTIMSLVSLVSAGMVTVLLQVPRLAAITASLSRVERFLLREPVKGLSTELHEKGNAVTEIGRMYSTWRSCTPELRNATLSYQTSSAPILRNVSIRFSPGGVTVIHGPAGSGKSSLVRVLLGEKLLDEGIVTMPPGPAGYCDATPWLVEKDPPSNIIGNHEYVEEWYKKIAWACLISGAEDVSDDKGMTGENDSNLALEQKQRIQLARAAYGRPNLLVLDEPCRGLDDETSMAILDRLFGPGGVMRLLGITTIITTANASQLAVADVAYSLDGEGHVEALEKPSQSFSATVSEQVHRSPTREIYNPAAGHLDKTKTDNTTKDENDDWLVWFLADSAGWEPILFGVMLLTCAAVSERFPPVYIRIWLSTEPENKYCFVGYAIVTMFPAILTAISVGLFYLQCAPAMARSFHQNMVTSVFNPSVARLSKLDSTQLTGFFCKDLSVLTQELPRYAINVLPVIPATVFALQNHYMSIHSQVQSLAREATAPLLAHFRFATQGIIHIRAMRWESVFLKDCQKLIDHSLRPHYAVSCMQRWLHLVIDAIVATLAIVCIETAIGLAMLNLVSFGSIMCRLFDGWVNLQGPWAALNRLKLLTEAAKPKQKIQYKREFDNWKTTTGRFDMYAVTAGFDGCYTDNDALRNVSVQMPSASKLAIIGPPGSGKSSLLLSILTLLDFAGTIYIDGSNVQNIPPDVLRESVVTLPQGGVQLPGSIRRNLDPWATPEHSFSDAEIFAVLDRVGLAELVQARGGLSTNFDSARLSSCEKQLLFLARAILRKGYLEARLVLVDDITSDVDEETADRIQDIIETTFADCTVVTVTSRMEMLRNMEKIIEMHEGRVVNMIDRPRPAPKDDDDYKSDEMDFGIY